MHVLTACSYQAPRTEPDASLEESIRQRLLGQTSVDFKDVPLLDAIDELTEPCGIDVRWDRNAMEKAAIGNDTPVTLNMKQVSREEAIQLLLRPAQLTFVINDDALMITTVEALNKTVEGRN